MGIKQINELRRAPGRAMVAGVCVGISYWAGIPAWIVRGAACLAALVFFPALLAYGLAWLLMPKWSELPADFDERAGAEPPAAPPVA